MRIACPSCAAEYEVPESRLTPRKMVRCVRCGGEWIAVHDAEDVTPPTDVAPPEPPASRSAPEGLPAVSAMDRLAVAPPRRLMPSGLIAAWVMTFVILIGAIAATIIWRQAIILAWPASALILRSSDLTVPPPTKPAKKAE